MVTTFFTKGVSLKRQWTRVSVNIVVPIPLVTVVMLSPEA